MTADVEGYTMGTIKIGHNPLRHPTKPAKPHHKPAPKPKPTHKPSGGGGIKIGHNVFHAPKPKS